MFQRLLLIVAFLGIAIGQPAAQTFSNVYFFGDSATDSGRYFYLPTFPGGPSAAIGPYTTSPGPMWSVAIGRYFDHDVTTSAAPGGGNNYAAGGARVDFINGLSNAWSTRAQIADYFSSTGGHADPNAIYFYWIGINDLKPATTGGLGNVVSPPNRGAIATLAQQAIGQVKSLSAAGARYILVPNTLIMSKEAAAATGFTFSQDSVDARALYDQSVWNGLAAQGVNFIPADLRKVHDYILTHPAEFGIINTNFATPACGAVPAFSCGPADLVAPNADQTYYWADGAGTPNAGHWTTAVHKIVADYLYSLIVAPSLISMLPEASVKNRMTHVNVVQNQIPISLRNRSPASWNAWVTGDISSLEIKNSPGFPDDPGNPASITAAVDYLAANAWLVGFALSAGTQKAEFSQNFGVFRQNEFAVSLYAARHDAPVWLDVIATVGVTRFNVNRDVPTGIATQHNKGNTLGYNFSLAAEFGYDFKFGSFTHGPFAGATLQHVIVDGFTEDPNFTALQFDRQARNSAVGVLGYQIAYDLARFRPYVKFGWHHEFVSSDRMVTTYLTTVSAPGYRMPAVVTGSDWITASLGTTITLSKSTTGLVTVSSQKGQDNVTAVGIQFGLNIVL
jgi:outer membrane lipase/esterase